MISCTSLGNGAAGQTPAALCRTCQQPPESSPAFSGLHTRLSPPLPSQTLKTAFRSPPQPFSGSPVASVIASRVRTVSLAEPHGRPPFPPAAAPPATRPPARRSCGGGCRPLFHDPAPRSPSRAPNSCAALPRPPRPLAVHTPLQRRAAELRGQPSSPHVRRLPSGSLSVSHVPWICTNVSRRASIAAVSRRAVSLPQRRHAPSPPPNTQQRLRVLGPRRTQPAQRGSSCHLAVHVEGSSHGSIARFFLPLIPILSYA